MKKYSFAIAMLLPFVCIISMGSSYLNQDKAPATVIKSFQQKFPDAQKVKWGKEDSSEWEADFILMGRKSSANFDENGMWLETESEIPASQLPDNVVKAVNASYPGYKIIGSAKIESAKSGILFETDIKSGLKTKEVIFKEDGTLVN
jgi:Putative beta-lactamase-inhibitor-like, PepSY-like